MAKAQSVDITARREQIAKLRRLPAQVAALVAPLTPAQLTTPFLAGEWSVAQNVHHLADSHMNSFIRLKLILTEENPTIRPYDQDAWVMTPDAKSPDVQPSLALLAALHQRWADLFESLDEAQWQRTGMHPESGVITPASLAEYYAAHGEGHIAQMLRTLAAEGK
jgi:hypothetical protein